jgi:hypothetical protein
MDLLGEFEIIAHRRRQGSRFADKSAHSRYLLNAPQWKTSARFFENSRINSFVHAVCSHGIGVDEARIDLQ